MKAADTEISERPGDFYSILYVKLNKSWIHHERFSFQHLNTSCRYKAAFGIHLELSFAILDEWNSDIYFAFSSIFCLYLHLKNYLSL